MNVNNINRGLAVYQNSIPTKPSAHAKRPTSRGNDSMILSETAKDFRLASEAVKNSPDIRLDKVERLREQLASDSYKINIDEISERILKSGFDSVSI